MAVGAQGCEGYPKGSEACCQGPQEAHAQGLQLAHLRTAAPHARSICWAQLPQHVALTAQCTPLNKLYTASGRFLEARLNMIPLLQVAERLTGLKAACTALEASATGKASAKLQKSLAKLQKAENPLAALPQSAVPASSQHAPAASQAAAAAPQMPEPGQGSAAAPTQVRSPPVSSPVLVPSCLSSLHHLQP